MRRQDWWPGKGRALRRVLSRGDVRADLLFWLARGFWVDAWISSEEEAGRSHGGEDLLDAAPETPREAYAHAEEYAREVQAANRKDLVELYRDTLARSGRREDEPARRDFGVYLAMQALGHGVTLEDEFPGHEVRVPLTDFVM